MISLQQDAAVQHSSEISIINHPYDGFITWSFMLYNMDDGHINAAYTFNT